MNPQKPCFVWDTVWGRKMRNTDKKVSSTHFGRFRGGQWQAISHKGTKKMVRGKDWDGDLGKEDAGFTAQGDGAQVKTKGQEGNHISGDSVLSSVHSWVHRLCHSPMFRDWVLPKGQMGYTYVHSPWEADLELNFQVAPAIHLLSLIKGEKFLTLPAFFF
jgi:hypothetical protein